MMKMSCNLSAPVNKCVTLVLPAPNITDGFDVLVQDVMAAITTEPCRSV